METTTPSITELAENITKMSQKIIQDYVQQASQMMKNSSYQDVMETYTEFGTHLVNKPEALSKVQDLFKGFLDSQQELWKRLLQRQMGLGDSYQPVITPDNGDKRFKSADWDQPPYYFDYVKQSYLLVSKLMKDIVSTVDLNEASKKKLSFYTQQYIDAFAPTNFAMTNPEVMKLAQETNGKSLIDGFKNFLTDMEKGAISQTDMSAFTPGKNIAITPGKVVFENELIQLIQYTPSTAQVHEQPLLVLPPWINKFYILDLRAENSFVKYLVDQGFTTYLISWRNPGTSLSHITFDDYVTKGSLKALEVIQSISKAKKINTIGYCLGGTLLGITLAILGKTKSKEENPVGTATFLATMLDFSDVGPMGDIIDEKLVKQLENGELLKKGIMSGHDMEHAFNFIRANDLVWSFVVNNYLKGKTPTPFDVMYWTNDNTNLPARMYLFYLRYMVYENKLSRKNALRMCDTPIDMGKIDIPVTVIGFVEDHIAPAKTAFTTTELVSGDVEYILGESGHVMGVVNPPVKKKYGYYVGGELEFGFDHWKKSATHKEGSWWTIWTEKLAKHSGKMIAAPTVAGNATYKAIEPAPGKFVNEKPDGHHAGHGNNGSHATPPAAKVEAAAKLDAAVEIPKAKAEPAKKTGTKRSK